MTPPPLYVTPKASLASSAESDDVSEPLVHPTRRDQTTPALAGTSGQAVSTCATEMSLFSSPFNRSIGVVSTTTSQLSGAASATAELLTTSPGVVATSATNDSSSNGQAGATLYQPTKEEQIKNMLATGMNPSFVHKLAARWGVSLPVASDNSKRPSHNQVTPAKTEMEGSFDQPPIKEEVVKGVLVSGMPRLMSGLATKTETGQDATQQPHHQVTPAAYLEQGTATPTQSQYRWTPPPLLSHTTIPVVKRPLTKLIVSNNCDDKRSRVNDTTLPPMGIHIAVPPPSNPTCESQEGKRPRLNDPPRVQPNLPASDVASKETFHTGADRCAHLKKPVQSIFSVPRVSSPEPSDESNTLPADKSTLLASAGPAPRASAASNSLALNGSSLLATAASSHCGRGNGQIGSDGLGDQVDGERDDQTNKPFNNSDLYQTALRRDMNARNIQGSFKVIEIKPSNVNLFDAVATDASILLGCVISAEELRQATIDVQTQYLDEFFGATKESLDAISKGNATGGDYELHVMATLLGRTIHLVCSNNDRPVAVKCMSGYNWCETAQKFGRELRNKCLQKKNSHDTLRRLPVLQYSWERNSNEAVKSIALWWHNRRLTQAGVPPDPSSVNDNANHYDLLRRVDDDTTVGTSTAGGGDGGGKAPGPSSGGVGGNAPGPSSGGGGGGNAPGPSSGGDPTGSGSGQGGNGSGSVPGSGRGGSRRAPGRDGSGGSGPSQARGQSHGRNTSAIVTGSGQVGTSSGGIARSIPPPILGPAAILKRDYEKSRESRGTEIA